MEFEEKYKEFYEILGESKKMVLSTSLNDNVTSRMMSIIILNEKLYFQTDRTSKKYRQLKGNSNVSLCADNLSIDGHCEEAGTPLENVEFLNAYKKHFPNSYARYTSLKNERLFIVTPTFIKRWLYIEGIPYMEVFDVTNRQYTLSPYVGV